MRSRRSDLLASVPAMRDEAPHDTIGGLLRYGTVASVDHGSARVTLTIGDIETQPVRWLHGPHGETRVWSPPSTGEQVLLICPEGDIEGGIALRGVSFQSFPPAGESKRELIQFGDGAVLAYDPESHKLEAVLPDGATVSIVAPGGVTIDADVRITGDLQVDGRIHADGDIVADAISLKSHRHGGVQGGAAKTAVPE